MLHIQLSEERVGTHQFNYTAFYFSESLPINEQGAWIVGRSNKSCDSLLDNIARDINGEEYRVTCTNGSLKPSKKRIERYLEKKVAELREKAS